MDDEWRELRLEKPVAGGRMLARTPDGVVLVAGGLPGERVLVAFERRARGVAYARVVDVLDADAGRRPAGFDWRCGGCTLAFATYERQIELKQAIVADAFSRIGRVALDAPVPVEPSPERGYRMRARVNVRGRRVGFFREGTHDICDAADTGLLLPAAGALLREIEDIVRVAPASDVDAIEIVENLPASERVLHLDLRQGRPVPAGFARTVAALDGVTGLTWGGVHQRRMTVLAGAPRVSDPLSALCGHDVHPEDARVERCAPAFFQANRYLVKALASAVNGLVADGPVVDLYAGVGLFACAIAARGNADVVAVEGDVLSAADLDLNARPFGGRLSVHHASVETFLAERQSLAGATVILDPPRTGMSRAALTGVVAARPPAIVYVSCDVATLARDTRTLLEAGYRLAALRAFDLFPNTAHVEALASFVRTNGPGPAEGNGGQDR
jgi:23S rRNA (uracil1939-C5)-methyltransferase